MGLLDRIRGKTAAQAVAVKGNKVIIGGKAIPILTIGELGEQMGIPGLQWADERQWCKHAHTKERPATCTMFATDAATPTGFCRLNGYSDPAKRTPCVFDEPQEAAIWQKVARWHRGSTVNGMEFLTLNPEQINNEPQA